MDCLGLNKDPNFATNHWIYLYYSDPVKSENILTRYTLKRRCTGSEIKKSYCWKSQPNVNNAVIPGALSHGIKTAIFTCQPAIIQAPGQQLMPD